MKDMSLDEKNILDRWTLNIFDISILAEVKKSIRRIKDYQILITIVF